MRKVFRLPLVFYRKIRFIIWKIINRLTFYRYSVLIEGAFKINGVIFIRNAGFIKIGNCFSANSGPNNNPIGGDTILRINCQQGAKIIIGNNCAISNSTLWANEEIVIEDNVFIGGGCRIWDNDFHSLDTSLRVKTTSGILSKPILIKKNSFIGGGSIILKGVSIGENSIIGAGSVVTKSVPNGEIWAGNPAKFIKFIN